jgi:phage terminase Nu1 subunit (DNA packaging protein)
MKFCDTGELCELLDVHKTTIHGWMKAGMPVYERGHNGKSHKFLVKDVIHWQKQRAVETATGNVDLMSADEAKRRKLQAEAGLQEIELAKKKGTVVDLEELERELSNKFAELRSNLRMIPSRVSMQVLGEEDETKIKNIILAEIDKTLEVLADSA